MQKQFTSFVLAILFGWMLGCNSNPVQVPDQKSNTVSAAGQQIQLLELPGPSGVNLAKTNPVTILVNADSGGEVEVTGQFQTATLTVPKNALSRNQDISMLFNGSKTQIGFGPEGLQFKKHAKLNYTATGLDFSSVPFGTVINLYYYNEKTGTYEEMNSDIILYNRWAGTLICINGDIPHFCIYAFGYIKR